MAKIYRVSGYLVDPNDYYFNKDDVEEIITPREGFYQQLHIEESESFTWDDDLPINYDECDMAHLESYFSKDSINGEPNKVIVGAKYRHFKGEIVEVLEVARHTEHINDIFVVYRCEDGRVWCRPYDMFISEVDRDKYPYAKQKYRFELI